MSKVRLKRSIGVKADVANEALTEHYDRHGNITPRRLVDESEPIDAPLHPAFTWDNDDAADKYRLYEARKIVKSVVIVNEETNEDECCAFVHVTTLDGEGEYHPVDIVSEDDALYTMALDELQQQLARALKAVEQLKRRAGDMPERQRFARGMAKRISGALSTLDAAAE